VKVAVIIGSVLSILLMLELGLRWRFGFGNPLLYQADPDLGYLLVPNQRTRRFGNRIEINQYSMRSSPIAPTRSEQTFRVLLLGDSVANGGWWTDQTQTISAQLQHRLSALTQFDRVEVLNASANSWGPRNELAYLQQFGSFESQMIVLIINTDDLFATAPTSLPVGRDRNYPNRKPLFALTEVFSRYGMPQKPIPELAAVQQEGGDRVGINLNAIEQIHLHATRSNAQLLVVLTPLLRELGEGGSRDYERKARQRLTDFTQQNQIPLMDVLPIFQTVQSPNPFYHDHIHLNDRGNRQIADMIAEKIQTQNFSP
jgi:lysophospholipase L1-like esterase